VYNARHITQGDHTVLMTARSRLAVTPILLGRIRDAAIILVTAAALFSIITPTIADPDLWGHVRFGQDIIANGGLVRRDPYSYTAAGAAWINHEWLSEVAFAWAYGRAGPGGLIALKLVLCFATLAAIYAWLRTRGVRLILVAIILLASSVLLPVSTGTVRPQLFTLLFFTLTLLCLARYEAGLTRPLLALPALFALWVNLHGGVLAGAAVLVVWSGARSLARLFPSTGVGRALDSTHRRELALVAASLLATLLNPYGPGLPLFLLRTGTVMRPEITEWQPVELTSLPGAVYLVLASLSLLALWFSRRPKAPAMLAVYAAVAIAPLSAVRHLSLFVIGFAVAVGDHLASAWERWRREAAPSAAAASPRFTALLAMVSLAGALFLLARSACSLDCIELRPGLYPSRAVAIVGAALPEGDMAIHFNWGEYAIWHLGPRIRVSMDGRRETVYPDDTYAAYARLMTGTGDWDQLLREHPADVALVRTSDAVYNLLQLSPDWELVYEDDLSAIFTPPDKAAAFDGLAQRFADVRHDGAGMCFR
jgi:hypothetical protein